MGIIVGVMMTLSGVTTRLHSLTRVFRLKRKARAFEIATLSHVEVNTQWAPFEDPPVRYTTSAVFRRQLRELMLPRRLRSEVESGHIDQETADITDWDEFYTGDPTTGELIHHCRGCCKDALDCKRRGRQKTKKTLFGRTGKLFELARWGKQEAPCKEWLRKTCIGNLAKHAFNLIHFKEENDMLNAAQYAVASDRERIALEIGVRLRGGRAWVNHELTRFNLVLTVLILDLVEIVVATYFSIETVVTTCESRYKKPRRTSTSDAADGKLYAVEKCVNAVIRAVCDVWAELKKTVEECGAKSRW